MGGGSSGNNTDNHFMSSLVLLSSKHACDQMVIAYSYLHSVSFTQLGCLSSIMCTQYHKLWSTNIKINKHYIYEHMSAHERERMEGESNREDKIKPNFVSAYFSKSVSYANVWTINIFFYIRCIILLVSQY